MRRSGGPRPPRGQARRRELGWAGDAAAHAGAAPGTPVPRLAGAGGGDDPLCDLVAPRAGRRRQPGMSGGVGQLATSQADQRAAQPQGRGRIGPLPGDAPGTDAPEREPGLDRGVAAAAPGPPVHGIRGHARSRLNLGGRCPTSSGPPAGHRARRGRSCRSRPRRRGPGSPAGSRGWRAPGGPCGVAAAPARGEWATARARPRPARRGVPDWRSGRAGHPTRPRCRRERTPPWRVAAPRHQPGRIPAAFPGDARRVGGGRSPRRAPTAAHFTAPASIPRTK